MLLGHRCSPAASDGYRGPSAQAEREGTGSGAQGSTVIIRGGTLSTCVAAAPRDCLIARTGAAAAHVWVARATKSLSRMRVVGMRCRQVSRRLGSGSRSGLLVLWFRALGCVDSRCLQSIPQGEDAASSRAETQSGCDSTIALCVPTDDTRSTSPNPAPCMRLAAQMKQAAHGLRRHAQRQPQRTPGFVWPPTVR